ncbi:MAG: energy-coupling factor transporter transmembrane protein EcfT [Oscillospiraceae bacterium]|nr:energy-coupling factor transporter transmembrane protein EcfT [Oscillospiraceae bacterium]
MALKDITLGQFFPGSTFLHRLDPRTKLLLVIFYIVALFTARNIAGYALCAAVLAIGAISSKVGFKALFKGLRPVLVILAFTAVLNLFYTVGEGEPLVSFWIFRIYWEGIRTAFFMLIRITMLISSTFLLTYTTSPIRLTDAIEDLLGPLKKIRVPVHELAMIMSIALRFIPLLIEETDKIMSAQKARGADFETGNLIQRAKALIPLLVPLFVSAFRRADELATAMECRCYHGGEGRTRMVRLQYALRDYLSLLLGLCLCLGVFGLNLLGVF